MVILLTSIPITLIFELVTFREKGTPYFIKVLIKGIIEEKNFIRKNEAVSGEEVLEDILED